MHNVRVIVRLFNALFIDSLGTELKTGGDEPLYLPRGSLFNSEATNHDLIISTKDYFSSALHEIGHWCIAGLERRKQVDYGYWYQPDGRGEAEQREFEQVEVKPQALEWLFTEACDARFHLSVDNIEAPGIVVSDAFKYQVVAQTHRYLDEGVTGRAGIFLQALINYYRPNRPHLSKAAFTPSKLAS